MAIIPTDSEITDDIDAMDPTENSGHMNVSAYAASSSRSADGFILDAFLHVKRHKLSVTGLQRCTPTHGSPVESHRESMSSTPP